MLKKTAWLVSMVLAAVIVHTVVLPHFNRPPEYVDAPDYCKAIAQYAKYQMSERYLGLPSTVLNWDVDDVQILKIEEIPGPHNRKLTTATICGSYVVQASGNKKKPVKGKFNKKLVFNIGNKYPSGIDVQHVRFP